MLAFQREGKKSLDAPIRKEAACKWLQCSHGLPQKLRKEVTCKQMASIQLEEKVACMPAFQREGKKSLDASSRSHLMHQAEVT